MEPTGPYKLESAISTILLVFIFGGFVLGGLATLTFQAFFPPITALHVDCLSPTGETFTTDIATNIYKLDYMKYKIREFGGNEIVFEGFCASRERE